MFQSVVLCVLGGGLGMAMALYLGELAGGAMEAMIPAFRITGETLTLAACSSLLVGLVAGIVPSMQAGQMACVEALRSEE